MSMRQTVPSPANVLGTPTRRNEPPGERDSKYASVYPVAAANPHGFYWRWRSLDGTAHSGKEYVYFYDCLENALAAGYVIDFSHLKSDRDWHS
jgi:hypothetical protein